MPYQCIVSNVETSVLCCCTEVSAIETQIKDAKARKKRASTAITGDMSEMLDSLPTFELLLDRATVQSRLQQQLVVNDDIYHADDAAAVIFCFCLTGLRICTVSP